MGHFWSPFNTPAIDASVILKALCHWSPPSVVSLLSGKFPLPDRDALVQRIERNTNPYNFGPLKTLCITGAENTRGASLIAHLDNKPKFITPVYTYNLKEKLTVVWFFALFNFASWR